jgi:SRSO17 transposase
MVGGSDARLIVDYTALPKKGAHSVGVAPQYASSLGKTANCQSLVSLTLASREVPVMVGLRLFPPESWTSDPQRMVRARVPESGQDALCKPEIAIEEIDRVIASGVRFGCVLADSGCGSSRPFRQALARAVCCGRLGYHGARTSIRQMSRWRLLSQKRVSRVNTTSPNNRPSPPKQRWLTRNGKRSVGAGARKAA